jgi:hypothetical protein
VVATYQVGQDGGEDDCCGQKCSLVFAYWTRDILVPLCDRSLAALSDKTGPGANLLGSAKRHIANLPVSFEILQFGKIKLTKNHQLPYG